MRLVVVVPAAALAALAVLLLLAVLRRWRFGAREYAEAERLSAARAITTPARRFDAGPEAGE